MRNLVGGVLAIVAVLAAFFLREAIVAWLGSSFPPYVVFYPTLMLVALLAGLWPGVVATALAAFLSARWILPPHNQWAVSSLSDAVGLGLFAAMGLFLSGVSELYRQSRRKVIALEKAALRQESEEFFRRQREWFRVTLTSIGEAVMVADTTGRVTFLNPIAEALTGWTAAEAQGLPVGNVFQLVDLASRVPAEDLAQRVLRAGCPLTLDEQAALVDRMGREIPIESVASPIQERADVVSGVVLVFHDVTHKCRAAESSARERANLQAIFNAVNVGLLLLDERGAVRRMNDTVGRWVGKEPATCHGAQPGDVVGCIHAIADAVGCGHAGACGSCPIRRAFEDALRSGAAVQGIEAEVVLMLGGREARLWLAVSADPLTLEGRPHVLLALNDVTDRKRAEAELRRERDLRQLVMNGAKNCHLVYLDREFNFVRVNETYAKTCGYTPEAMVGKNHFALYPDEENQAIFARVRDTGLPAEFHDRPFVFPDQPERGVTYWDWTLMPVKDHSGRVEGLVFSLVETTDRKRAEGEIARLNQDLERRVDELQTIFNTTPIGLAIAEGPDACHIHGNPAIERMVGVASGGELWKTAAEAVPYRCLDGDRELAPHQLPLQRAVCGETVIGQVMDVLREDARRLTLYCSAAPLFDEEGRPRGAVGAFLDITPLREADKKLHEAKAAAEAANVAKSQFLASMSHELRTPMNAILGMTDLALDEPLPPAARDYLLTARESAGLLLELLNEILDFSRIEAGRFELESAPFCLRRTVEQVVKSMGVQAYEKGLELVCDVADDLPEALVGDPLRIRQVLMNLLSNAIKFTSKGEVIVTVGVVERTPLAVTVQFSVADTGIGIAPEHQQRVFAPFTQADASTTRRFGGTGLGLAISQRLVSMMGGRIWLQSQPGEGSTFFFTAAFPLADPSVSDRSVPATPERDAFTDVRVLVVAENATSRRILRQILRSWTMCPDAAADVPAALAKIHEAAGAGHAYRLVLADAAMPGIDGFTLAGWLQQDERLAGSTILMVSTSDRQCCPDRCGQVGAICLDKPVSRSTLFNAVASALGVVQSALSSPSAETPAPLSAAPPRTLRVLLAEDTPANQKLVLHVLGRRGHSIVVANHGEAAVGLLREQEFDLVLMDVQMPVMDGFQATAEIRKLADSSKAQVPIVAMTAHAMKGDAERCLAAGMDAYLSKPIKSSELVELVERLGSGDSEPPDLPAERTAAVSDANG